LDPARDRREYFARFLDRLLASKRAVADQDTDMIDAHFAERPSFCGGRNFVDLDDHAASWEVRQIIQLT
jgi:hypothetical protein